MDKPRKSLKRVLYENGLSLSILVLFVIFISLQIRMGLGAFNDEQQLHGLAQVGLAEYLREPHFWTALFENWESEFLQMGLLIVLSERLRQKGSAQSRKLKEEEPEEEQRKQEVEEKARKEGKVPGPVRAGGWKLKLYSNSLLLVFLLMFFLSMAGHQIASHIKQSSESLEHGVTAPSFIEHLASNEFWFESMQNWQSEFLAIFAIVVLSIWLRAKDSTESKPVGAAHDYTGH